MTDSTTAGSVMAGAGIPHSAIEASHLAAWERRQQAASAREEKTLAILAWLMVIGYLSAKLSVTLVAGTALELVLPFEYAILAVLLFQRAVEIRLTALIGLLLFFFLVTITTMANDAKFTSVMYVYMNYLPFAFFVRLSRTSYNRFLNIHQSMMIFLAIVVFIDWIFQIAGKPMPNMEHFLLSSLRFFNFNYIQPLQYGAKWMKPNGFFMLETSYIAQSMAVALVLEFCLFRRTLYLGVYLSALLLTFGGTGFTLLLLSFPMMAFYARTKTVGLALALIPLALVLAASFGLFDNITHRMEEFNQQGSSGDQRFAGQVREFESNIDNPAVLLKGIGAGNTSKGSGIVWNPPVKVTMEYGLFTGLTFLALLVYCSATGGTPAPLSYVLLVQFLLLNGGFLVPVNIFYLTVLSCMVKMKPEPNRPQPLPT